MSEFGFVRFMDSRINFPPIQKSDKSGEAKFRRNFIITASLNKALAMPGGVIFSDEETVAQIRQMPMFAGASPMMPALLDAFVNSIDFYREQQQKLSENIAYFNRLIPKNTFLDSIKKSILFNINFPASIATLSGWKGDNPAAMASAFTNSEQFKISGKMVSEAVVFPAPLHPAMIYKFGFSTYKSVTQPKLAELTFLIYFRKTPFVNSDSIGFQSLRLSANSSSETCN